MQEVDTHSYDTVRQPWVEASAEVKAAAVAVDQLRAISEGTVKAEPSQFFAHLHAARAALNLAVKVGVPLCEHVLEHLHMCGNHVSTACHNVTFCTDRSAHNTIHDHMLMRDLRHILQYTLIHSLTCSLSHICM